MKIATLSFELKKDKMALTGVERGEIIMDVLKKVNPDLLVCSGYSLDTNADLQFLQQGLRKMISRSTILVEVQHDSNIIKNGHPLKNKYPDLTHPGSHNMYIIKPDGELVNLGPQYFSQGADLNGKANKFRIHEFDNILENRIFEINGRKVLVLCCGEINVIEGRDHILFRSEKIEKSILQADIILNPTHDCMANYGTLIAKRKFLSLRTDNRNALYVNSSNWNSNKSNPNKPEKVTRQNPNNSFMQNLYLNGVKIAMEKEIGEGKYLLSIVDVDF